MRVILQRVLSSSVSIDGKKVAEIGKGLLLLVGFTFLDTPETAKKMAEKIKKLRIFEDENGKTNLSLDPSKHEILSVSQFTLYASLKEGNRPSFVEALPGEEANKLYAIFNNCLSSSFPLKTGVFGADMKVEILNDGPFTLILDSKELFK